MNPIVQFVLEKAFVFPNSLDKRDTALDIMFAKLIVIPIQKKWRSKSPEQKAAISKFIRTSITGSPYRYKSFSESD